MDKQRILREAQKIAAKFAFWMVSGNIEHLYGYAYESQGKKYELEIKFKEDFPDQPPKIVLHDEIKKLLGEITLDTLKNWGSSSQVVDIVSEIRDRIREKLKESEESETTEADLSVSKELQNETAMETDSQITVKNESEEKQEYVTPDLNAYPPDFEYESYLTPNNNESVEKHENQNNTVPLSDEEVPVEYQSPQITTDLFIDEDEIPLALSTELGLIQQEYAYDQVGDNPGKINIYLTITLTKTFIISIDFQNYPKRPIITLPKEVRSLIADPYHELENLKKWNPNNPVHVVEVLHELEKNLSFINQAELESKKIRGEYKCLVDEHDLSSLKVILVTYGFKEYTMEIDLRQFPKIPRLILSPELETLIEVPVNTLDAHINWEEGESEAVELVREISWLVDKNSRINFEIELLKEHYKNIDYDSSTSILTLDMKGKMKTQDLTFQFEIDLPHEYPMKMPSIKIINEFEVESHEKIKNDLQSSFKDFYDEWNPFSYLVDLFNLISKKIFEVSVVSCVICHKIDCPTCNLKIAGPEADTCHVDCPYCDRSYHRHCWDQTIKSFGKCGFCLKTPPPNLMPN
jgi:ubiquitin-protein ligase